MTSATVRNRPQPSATVRNRPQPSATVRNRSRDPRMAVPMVSSPEGLIFEGFAKRLVASFRVAGVALRYICNVSKVVLCGRRNTSREVFQRCVAVFVAGAALWTCPASFCVAGAALQMCRVAFFCESHCQGCVKWRQGANSVFRRGIL